MRTLTKSGIRELTAKYRSVLKKCAILNAMVLMLGASSAMAAGLAKITDIAGGNGGGTSDASTIYFGNYWQTYKGSGETSVLDNYNKEGIKWRVLSNDTAGTGSKQMFLLSDQALYADQFDSNNTSNEWNTSEIRETLNNTTAGSGFAADAFNAKELAAIATTNNVDTDTSDKLFLLSADEAQNTGYGFTDDTKRITSATDMAKNVGMYNNKATVYVPTSNAAYWLRSPNSDNKVGIVGSSGQIGSVSVNDDRSAVRPALNLNQDSVLFVSAAVGGKSNVNIDDGFAIDNAYNGSNGWKLTLKDDNIVAPTNVEVTQTTTGGVDGLAQKASPGDTLDLTNGVTVNYDNPIIKYTADAISSGKANYVSAIAVNSSGNFVNYAKISDQAGPKNTIPLDSLADGTYKMFIFAEQANGDYQTDYASAFSNTDGYTFGKGSGTVYEGKLSSTYKDKNLTAQLGNQFNLSFDNYTYNTSILVPDNETGTITADNEAGGTTLKGGISVGNGATLTTKNTFRLRGANNIIGTVKGDALEILTNTTFVNNTGSIENEVTVGQSGTLEAYATGLKNIVTNNGKVNLIGGMLEKTITGTGTTNIKGDVTASAKIGTAITIDADKILTASADNIGGDITNSGIIKFTDGQLEQTVSGGNVTIDGDVISNASLESAININENKTLTIGADNIGGNVTNDGIFNLKTGTLNNNVLGDGDTNLLTDDSLKIADGKTLSNLKMGIHSTLDQMTPTGSDVTYETVKIGTLSVEDPGSYVNMTFDVSNMNNDKIEIQSSANGTFILTGINIVDDLESGTIHLFTGAGNKDYLRVYDAVVAVSDGNYYKFTQNTTNKGDIDVLKAFNPDIPWTIQDVISANTRTDIPKDTIKINTYQLASDINLDRSLGTTKKYAGDTSRSLTINGNGHVLNGQDNVSGIVVSDDVNLTLNNVNMKNFKIGGFGGAIHNKSTSTITSITGDFSKNSAEYMGGAIYNLGEITSITGDFDGNYANNGYGGGAIYNTGAITIETSSDHNNIKFSDNYVTAGDGGAIYNGGTVNLNAVGAEDSITFVGGVEDGKYDIDGIYNTGILNINGNGTDKTYAGTVELYNVSDDVTEMKGKTNIYGGTVNFNGNYLQNETNINGGTTTTNGDFIQNRLNINNANLITNKTLFANEAIKVKNGSIRLGENTVASSATTPLTMGNFALENSTLNLQNNSTGTVYLGGMYLDGSNNIMLDADLAGDGKMDQLKATSLSGDGNIVISDIKLLSDAAKDEISLDLFADDTTKTALKDKVSGNLSGLKYSPTYLYDAQYDTDDGMITFTRHNSGSSDDYNPYLYAPSTMAQTTANITGQIAGLAMDKLDAAVADGEKGLAGGDMPKASNAWVKVMGFDDDVDFKHFNSVDSKAYTLAGGFNTDKVQFADVDAAFGIYGGYIGGRQKYTGNKIEQDGGYIGLSSELTKGNAFLLSTINTGFINNEDENMYGTDKFDTRWFGVGLKGGYNYAINDTWTLQPNIYAGYTLVNTEDYTSKSGVRINNDNLNFFEIDPGFKLSKQIDNGWLGYIQGKYAIVMDNGGETTFNDNVLPNISAKNYFEYGFGMNKSLTDAWSLNGEINRRDGGRTGWNGSLEFKYNF